MTNQEIYDFIDLQTRIKYRSFANLARELEMKPQSLNNTLMRMRNGQDFNFQNVNRILNALGYNFIISEVK